jgi:acetyl-CoA carboxylase biotin carboxyl carrier protein
VNIKEIREYASIMEEMGLTVFEYSSNGESVKMERAAGKPAESGQPAIATQAQGDWHDDAAPAPGEVLVRSPMVGLYYSAPGTDSDDYVEVGDTVAAGDILCVIEAMKIMNEITAECDGVVTEICAENKQVVEFNQPLFRIARSHI